MDFNEFIQCGKIRCKMFQYQEKKKKAIELSRTLLTTSKSSYIALSGGKDSVAMAFIVAEAVRPGTNIRLWSHISDASFPGTVETCRAVAAQIGLPLDLDESKESAFEAVKRAKKQSFGKSGVFFDAVRSYAKDKDLCFVGVRARESKRRTKAAKAHGQVFYSASMGNITICNPLQWFTLEDVAAALFEYNAPIHPIYKKAPINSNKHGFDEESFIRLSYITSKDLLNVGTAVFLRINYPDKFNQLAEVYPEIRQWV